MKQTSQELINLLLASKQPGGTLVFCDLYTFTLTSGEVLRYTTADIDIADGNGNVYSSSGPYFDKVRTHKGFHAKVGLDTDTWQVTVAPRLSDPLTGAAYPDTIGSTPWLAAVVYGVLDGATVQIDRGYFTAWPQPPWGLNNPFPPTPPGYLSALFSGRVGKITYSRTTATITINSWIEVLQKTTMPANLFGNTCRHTLFDVGCTLSAAAFQQASSVVAPAPSYNSQYLNINVFPAAGLTYTLGRIVMTSGLNSGLQQRILGWNSVNQIQLAAPFPFTVNVGDEFLIYPGCDKSMTTCTAFNNLVNYGGFPFIPVPELGF